MCWRIIKMPDNKYNEYKQIRDLVLMMTHELEDLKQAYVNSVFTTSEVPFTKGVFDGVLPYTLDIIKNEMDIEEMRKALDPYEIIQNGYPSKLATLSDEKVKETMINVKSLSLVILQLEKECDDIKKEASNVMNEYMNYLSSMQLIKDKEEKLRLFKEANELEIDDNAKRANDRNIKILENQITYAFLTERIDEYGYKEKEKLMDKFFNDNKGKIVVDKFKAKSKRMGYNQEIFKYFLNIEENFLPEEYHPFNNFFLSLYMNFGGFCDDYIKADKLYFASITSAIASLIYHTYPTPEDENKFIEFIKSVIDRFKNDEEHGAEIVDKFKLLNRSYSKHPDRIKADKMREEIKRNTIFKRLEDLKIDNPFDENCDVNEALEYFNTKLDELKASQLEAVDADDDPDSIENVSDVIESNSETGKNILNAAETVREKLKDISEEDNDDEDNINNVDAEESTSKTEVDEANQEVSEEVFESEEESTDVNVDEITKAVESLYDTEDNSDVVEDETKKEED